jgi:hypothetical protein
MLFKERKLNSSGTLTLRTASMAFTNDEVVPDGLSNQVVWIWGYLNNDKI